MKITPDKQREADLFKALGAMAKADDVLREGYHVSDLLHPLKTYWQKISDIAPTEEELGYWFVGKGHHYFLVAALTGTSVEESFVDKETGIIATPDLLALSGEFKTTRWSIVPKGEKAALKAFKFYFPQCKAYAALTNRLIWYLYVLFISPYDKDTKRKIPRLKVYKLEFTKRELGATKAHLKRKKGLLEEALKKKSHKNLPLCTPGICYIDRGNGKIPICRFWDICKPKGRYASV